MTSMDINLAAVVITAIVTLAGSWLTARVTSRNTANLERQSDRDRIAKLEERDAEWERRCDVLWRAREADALVKRALGDHIDVLENHIWERKPPPPPPRPEGI